MEIFFPKRCVGCGKYSTYLCTDCAKKIEQYTTPLCFECGRITENGQYCPQCKRKTKTKLNGIIACANYEVGPTREIIHHLKYSGFAELAEVLGEIICQRLGKFAFKNAVVVPVPLHKKREAERGYNQCELIARYVCKKFDVPGGCALARVKKSLPQVKLDRQKRLTNLLGAFACIDRELILGKNVLLIDDVTTTGATLSECAAVLMASGAKKVLGIVVASAKK